MFNIKAIVMFVLALMLGTSAAYMAYSWIQQQTPDANAENADLSKVYVAARNIPYGESLDTSNVKIVTWPKEHLPEGVILASEDINGKLVNRSLLAGEPLLEVRVTEKLPGSRLSSIVTPTKRAITVRVNDVAGVAGFLLPGNRVDVLATRMENRRAITRTLIQDVRVLAVDQKANSAKDEPIVVRAVTLEADLADATLLASATEEGAIKLVLRNPVDRSSAKQASTSIEVDDQVTPEPTIAASKPVRRKNVTIIRGTDVTYSTIKQ